MNIIHCYKYSIFIVFKIIILKVKLGEVFSYIKQLIIIMIFLNNKAIIVPSLLFDNNL